MFGNNEIAHKSAENNPFPLENYFFNIPSNNALDITDIIRDLDISRHLSCVVLGRAGACWGVLFLRITTIGLTKTELTALYVIYCDNYTYQFLYILHSKNDKCIL